MKKIIVAAVALTLSALTVSAQSQSREDILRDIATKRAELAALEKLFLAPSEEDRAAYAEFLSQPDTGLMRLLPRDNYDSEAYQKAKRTLTVRGGGAYYSFTQRTHEYSAPTDIGLDHGILLTGFAGANYGMLTSLGDVPLENVNLETTEAQVLALHKPATEEPQARIEQRRSSDGTTIESTSYKNRLPLKLASTYLVRSVNYNASDALVVFRVVRIETDGSAIILWKLLKNYPVPQLARNK
jgi:hypothetical protein